MVLGYFPLRQHSEHKTPLSLIDVLLRITSKIGRKHKTHQCKTFTMDKQHKKRSINSVNDTQIYNQGEPHSFSSTDENTSEQWKRQRTTSHREAEVHAASNQTEHQSQEASSQGNTDPVQAFLAQPSASQLLLHVVLRYMASHHSQGLQPSPGSGALSTGAAFHNQPTSSFSRNEDRIRSGSFAAEHVLPSLTTSPGSLLSNANPNSTTSSNGYSSVIQNIINILLQQLSLPQQTNLPHSQSQQNQWTPATNNATPWSSQNRTACTSFPRDNTASNQESVMSMLTQSASRLFDQDQHFSVSIPSLVRNEYGTSAPSMSGGLSSLHDVEGSASRNSSSEPRCHDLSQILRHLSTLRAGTSDQSVHSSQSLLRDVSGSGPSHIPSLGNPLAHNTVLQRILAELLQASDQRRSFSNDHRIQSNDATAVQQSVIAPPTHQMQMESQRKDDLDKRRPTGRATAILAMSCDKDMLSPYQCLVRQQIELFEATQEDVNTNAQGRNRPIVLGQVGIRCRHCSFLALHLRSRGSTYYPSTATGLYQAAQNLASGHLCEHCKSIPSSVRDELCHLRERKSSAGGGKKYWADGVRSLGVVEDDNGLRFSAENSRC